MRRCLTCRRLTAHTRCAACRLDKKRNLYGGDHAATRARWTPLIARGDVHCAWPHCTYPDQMIQPDQPWDLGHQPDGTRLPEHQHCNRSHKDRTG